MMLAETCRAALYAEESGSTHPAFAFPISLIRSSVPATLNRRQTPPEISNNGRCHSAVRAARLDDGESRVRKPTGTPRSYTH